ncbi:MAG: three-Cys-motif partner protein TcmP [Gemmatimonadota bacterium]|nr:three-Cys-motif partner protein TcmP [Gemmatimonadota bacterium]
MSDYNFLAGLPDDRLYTPAIKRHSLYKIQIHNYYVNLFSTAMRKTWPQRAYLGLYSGAGRARVEETDEIVETTALSAVRVQYPFTKYIFVDNDPNCIDALKRRAGPLLGRRDLTLLLEDANSAGEKIIEAMPRYSPTHKLLSFCFIDPFSARLDFDLIRTLGTRYQMDFLIVLMLGRDVRTNFRQYLSDPSDTRIASLIDDPRWREEWTAKGHGSHRLIRFILEKFDEAMTRIGYRAARPDDAHPIRVVGRNVFLYSLVFYSKSPLGQKFWHVTRRGADPQIPLDI